MESLYGFTIYDKEDPQMEVMWNRETKEVTSKWLSSERHIKIPRTMYPENITWKNIMGWLETRVVPRTRIGLEGILKAHGLKEYNPYAMCKDSHALSMSDYIWIKFADEDIKYDNIKIR